MDKDQIPTGYYFVDDPDGGRLVRKPAKEVSMGWGNCGHDSKGRPIGYNFAGTCDHPGCAAEIDRGLAHACGGMHGEDEGCEGYFCEAHLLSVGGRMLCPACAEASCCGDEEA